MSQFVLIGSCLVVVCGSINYGYAFGYSSPIERNVMRDIGLSTSEYSLFGSMLTIGGLVGAINCGRATDYLGRRGAMWMTDTCCVFGWIVIAISTAEWSLYVGRIFVGVSLGLTAYVVPVYVAEITPENLRGGFVFMHMLMTCGGITIVYLLGMVVSWRLLAYLGIVPNVVQGVGLFFVPESPRWLAQKGREVECDAALQRLRGADIDIAREAYEIKAFTAVSMNLAEGSMLSLFQKKYAHALIVGVGLITFASFGGYPAIIYYAEHVFELAGLSGKLGTIAVAAIQIPTGVVALLLMDRFGRRPLLMISTTGLILGSLMGAFSFIMKTHCWVPQFSPYLLLIGILLFSAMYAIGMGGIVDLMLAEIFPINIKGAAGSACTLVGWSTAWATTFLFNFSLKWSPAGTFFILAGISGVTIVFVAFLVPETKGKRLEEIHGSMTLFGGRLM